MTSPTFSLSVFSFSPEFGSCPSPVGDSSLASGVPVGCSTPVFVSGGEHRICGMACYTPVTCLEYTCPYPDCPTIYTYKPRAGVGIKSTHAPFSLSGGGGGVASLSPGWVLGELIGSGALSSVPSSHTYHSPNASTATRLAANSLRSRSIFTLPVALGRNRGRRQGLDVAIGRGTFMIH